MDSRNVEENDGGQNQPASNVVQGENGTMLESKKLLATEADLGYILPLSLT